MQYVNTSSQHAEWRLGAAAKPFRLSPVEGDAPVLGGAGPLSSISLTLATRLALLLLLFRHRTTAANAGAIQINTAVLVS